MLSIQFQLYLVLILIWIYQNYYKYIINNKLLNSIMNQLKNINQQEIKIIDQFSDIYQQMVNAYQATHSICGHVVCGLAKYLSNQQWSNIKQQIYEIKEQNTLKFIGQAMLFIQLRRQQYCEQQNFQNKQRSNYMKDWVANYQIQDYINENISQFKNKNVYFFRNVSFDHPGAVEKVKHQQAQRIKFEKQFQGQKYFITKFPTKHLTLSQFQYDLNNNCQQNKPITIITDCYGHFTTILYYDYTMYVLDSTKYSKYMNNESCERIYEILNKIYKK